MLSRSVLCCRSWWHFVNLCFLLNFSLCSVTVLLSCWMDTPELLMTLTHRHWFKLALFHSHTLSYTHPLCDTNTHRAISNQSRWLLCSSLNGRPDLRYAELFPPAPKFSGNQGKKGLRKIERQGAWDSTFSLHNFNSFHLASQFARSWDNSACNEKVGCRREGCLLREHPSALTAAFQLRKLKSNLFGSLPSPHHAAKRWLNPSL